MAQLPYWILVDKVRVGVLLYSLPRLSVPLQGIPPMNILELARMWLNPDVQGKPVSDSLGRLHAASAAGCGLSQSLKRVRQDWFEKYRNMPDILAVVSWADDVHFEGGIYRACNFENRGKSGGSMHGNRIRPNGGRDQMNQDYDHIKTLFWYSFDRPLPMWEKNRILQKRQGAASPPQLSLIEGQ